MSGSMGVLGMICGGCSMMAVPREVPVMLLSQPDGASVYVDGRMAGRVPVEVKLDRTADHRVTFVKASRQPWTVILTSSRALLTHANADPVASGIGLDAGTIIPIPLLIDLGTGSVRGLAVARVTGYLDAPAIGHHADSHFEETEIVETQEMHEIFSRERLIGRLEGCGAFLGVLGVVVLLIYSLH